MQIIIVQAEIEAAIRAHIEQQVSIKEGMEITIDLRSTRGDAGFTANIDIVPASTPAGVKRTEPTGPGTVLTKAADTAAQLPKATATIVKETAAKEALPESAGSTAGAAAASAGTAPTAGEDGGAHPPPEDGAAPAAEASQEDETDPAPAEDKPAATAGRSLFKNLQRPVNA